MATASSPGLDTSVANAARMWNYWIGGKDNFSADRAAAEQVLEAMPALPLVARMLRRFLITAVDELTAAGVRQFLDIGTGLPTADNTHDVAQRAAPDSRIVYVDHDPVVISHAQALLTSSAAGKTDYIQADLRDWATISAGAQRTLDFSRPVAVLLIAVLHFILDAEDPHRMIDHMMADRPGPDAARPVVGIQSGHHGRLRPELLLRYRQKVVAGPGMPAGCARSRAPVRVATASKAPGSSGSRSCRQPCPWSPPRLRAISRVFDCREINR